VIFANLMTVDYAGTSSTRINRLILMANAGVLLRTGDPAPTTWGRHLGYLLDGLRSPGVLDPDEAPASRS